MRRAHVVAVGLLCLLVSRVDPVSAHGRPLSVGTINRFAKHCHAGCPEIKREWRRGTAVQIGRAAYALEVSTATKVPFWVAEYVTAEEVDGTADRSGYSADPALRDEPHATVKDYRDSEVKYDIGHQAPAANHKRSQNRMDETFYLSNMAPQVPSFNRGIWRMLEISSRKWIQQRGRAWCITGPIFGNGNPNYAPRTIGANRVAVPNYFYKILVAPLRRGSTEFESIAFIFPNKVHVAPYQYEKYIRSVAEIEQLTGIDFMPQLTRDERESLEGARAPELW
jgi:endonuclease G